QKFTISGSWVASWGSSGGGDGHFNDPVGVAVDTTGMVYVVDNLNSRVQMFSPAGVFLGKWGTPGSDPGQFTSPCDIAIGNLNRVYVVDANRIQRFDMYGNYETGWACPNASGVGVDAEGSVYAACKAPDHLVRKFTPDGTPVLAWGGFGNGVGQFNGPS